MYRWINPEKGRYHHAHLDNDMFGGCTLVLPGVDCAIAGATCW
jgi:hypothetical protein